MGLYKINYTTELDMINRFSIQNTEGKLESRSVEGSPKRAYVKPAIAAEDTFVTLSLKCATGGPFCSITSGFPYAGAGTCH
jgi:hypothetical protein